MNIFEIDRRMEEILAGSVDESTGELVFNEEELMALDMERDKKLENCACAYKNHKATATAIQAEIDELKARMAIELRKADRAQSFLDHYLSGQGFASAKAEVKYTKSTTTETDDDFVSWAKENNPALLTYKPAPEPVADKKAIAAAIKAGETVEHAWREEHQNIKIV